MWRNKVAALAAFVLAACQATENDRNFVIYDHGVADGSDVTLIGRQLGIGLSALRKLPTKLREDRLPVTVHLYAANGVSNSAGGQGPIHLYGVGRRNPAAIHELTHVLTGYRGLGGDAHWSSEGFATYMQDEHGVPAYPARGHAHGLARLIVERGFDIPMMDLMEARSRTSYFGLGVDAWTRWRVYALSASFTRYLIETYGMAKFIQLYDRRSSPDQAKEVERLSGKPAKETIAGWKRYLAGLKTPMGPAERNFNFFSRTFR